MLMSHVGCEYMLERRASSAVSVLSGAKPSLDMSGGGSQKKTVWRINNWTTYTLNKEQKWTKNSVKSKVDAEGAIWVIKRLDED